VPEPGMYGRREPKRAPAMQASRWLGVKAAYSYPNAVDYLARTGPGWNMLGNDIASDCVSVTWANARRLVTTVTGKPSYPGQAQVWQFYQTQNTGFDPAGTAQTNGPGSNEDNGMDIQTALEALVTTGGPDGVKAVAFGAVDAKNIPQVKLALDVFGYLWTGINVLAANLTEFGNAQPWNYVAGSQNDGGHSVLTGGYGPQRPGALGGDERFITWAQETSFTDLFWQSQVEEAWVCIWPEHLGTAAFQAGVNAQALAADFHQLTGRTLSL
jgi:hypothetical protein